MVLTTVIVFQERSASPLPEFGTVQHRPMYMQLLVPCAKY